MYDSYLICCMIDSCICLIRLSRGKNNNFAVQCKTLSLAVLLIHSCVSLDVLGERIIGAGLSSLALTAKQCDKRKAFEILAPSLLVNSEGSLSVIHLSPICNTLSFLLFYEVFFLFSMHSQS